MSFDTSQKKTFSPPPVKAVNPLLSATLTDFENSPVQLQIAAAPIVPTLQLGTKRDTKSLVTIGKSSDFDTESLDEINLNAPAIEENPPAQIDVTSSNINNNNINQELIEEQNNNNNDSLLSQAASSFSALPSVASSVLSTFSKRIYSASGSREQTPNLDHHTHEHFPENQNVQQQQQQQQQPQQPFYAPPGLASTGPPEFGDIKDPPKFYSPTEVPPLPAAAVPPITAATVGQNTYRLAAKKKHYAPIPGLSDNTNSAGPTVAAPVLDPFTVPSVPFDAPVQPLAEPLHATGAQQLQSQYFSEDTSRADDKKSGKLFSFTNLVPSGVLQNISGFVQSATGTLGQTIRQDQPHSLNAAQDSSNSSYSATEIQFPDPSLSTPFSVAFDQNPGSQQHSYGVAAPPSNFYQANLQQQQSQNFFLPTGALPAASSSYFESSQTQTSTGNIFAQPQIPNIQTSPAPHFSVPYDSAQGTTFPRPEASPGSLSSFFAPPTSATTTSPLLTPSPQLQPTSGQSSYGTPYQPPPVAGQPPQAVSQPPTRPPASSVGQTSFRLQKGTRLYKSPLSALESTPVATPLLPANTHQTSTPAVSLFNPFASSSEQPVPNLVPTQFSAPTITPANPGPENIQKQFETEIVQQALHPKPVDAPISDLQVADQLRTACTITTEETSPYNSNAAAKETTFLPPTNIEKSITGVATNIASSQLFQPPIEQTSAGGDNNFSGFSEKDPQLSSFAPLPSFQTNQLIEQTLPLNQLVTSEKSKSNEACSLEKPPLNQPPIEQFSSDTQSKAVNLATASPFPPSAFEPSALLHNQEAVPSANPVEILPVSIPPQATSQAPPAIIPPPAVANLQDSSNPYRRSLFSKNTTSGTQGSTAAPSLANFFTPIAVGSENQPSDSFNIFAPQTASQISQQATREVAEQAPVTPRIDGVSFSEYKSEKEEPKSAVDDTLDRAHIKNIDIYAPAEPSAPPAPVEDSPSLFGTIVAGFDNIVEKNQVASIPDRVDDKTTPKPITNTFANYFQSSPDKSSGVSQIGFDSVNSKSSGEQQQQLANFFDSITPTQSSNKPPLFPTVPVGVAPPPGININNSSTDQADSDSVNTTIEEQQLQNFFNNPPPESSDLNYNLVHSALGVKHLHTGSLASVSNIVEPPSSACSEFSELNNSTFTQSSSAIPSATNISSRSKVDTKLTNTNLETSPVHHKQPEVVASEEKYYQDLPEDVLKEIRMATEAQNRPSVGSPTAAAAAIVYTPALKHWFYKRLVGTKHIWTPFSHFDSGLLETSLSDPALNVIAVEGGRYDVNVKERIKVPVYWEGAPIEVRRCSWFYKGSDSKYVPYEEDVADRLEDEYKNATESGTWHRKIIISQGEEVVFHNATTIVHFHRQQNTDAWGGTAQTTSRPRVVKRDLDDFVISIGEPQRVDHLLLMVHGIGAACDLKLRGVEEVVDDFRAIAQNLIQSHYKNSVDMGLVGRVEVLPISWHGHLHSVEMGIDEQLKSITLESIPKLRNFTNDTLLDVFFYTSPVFCQRIMNTVAKEMNSIYKRYRERHPEFNGGVSVAGHSLGSLILFDLLCHQKPVKESEEQNMENPNDVMNATRIGESTNATTNQEVVGDVTKQVSYSVGSAGTGQPFIHYAHLTFQPKKFFALGSPIGMFVTVRGINKLGLDFRLPTCPGFYNIFHPFDPVAYRIEALINPDLSGVRPVLIPHHKGRKRMHLELKETMTRVGADLKQRFLDTFKNSFFDSVSFLGGTTARNKREAEEHMEKEVDKVLQMQMQIESRQQSEEQASPEEPVAAQNQHPQTSNTARSRTDSVSTNVSDVDMVELDFPLGKLNDSKRIDYVLQEAPLEFFNEYLFALTSHVCYWESSDTILFVMKEIYSGLGVSPDSQVPQQSLTIERPQSRNSVTQNLLPPTAD